VLLSEPSRSPYDLHLKLLGVPIRIHPWFWLVSLFLGMSPGSDNDPARVALWILASFVSVIVHEMGHALTIRHFGARPWITLYGMGGLASSTMTRRSPRTQILISLAGPAAGFALFGLVVTLVAATGHRVVFDWHSLPYMPVQILDGFENARLWDLTAILLSWNYYLGLLNLLPIYPLDGGQVARELFQVADPGQGLRRSIMVSVVVAAGAALWGLKFKNMMLILLFGMLAYENYMNLQQIYPGRGTRGRW
jgi:Zn-dependent protease